MALASAQRTPTSNRNGRDQIGISGRLAGSSSIKECQLDLFADRTSAATMCANQLRLWFAAMAYVLVSAVCAGSRVDTPSSPRATCDTIRLKLFKIGACGLASAASRSRWPRPCLYRNEFAIAHSRLTAAALEARRQIHPQPACRATDKTGASYCLMGGCYRDLPCR
ncbi:MAG: transposase [Stellaceae bacterium]